MVEEKQLCYIFVYGRFSQPLALKNVLNVYAVGLKFED